MNYSGRNYGDFLDFLHVNYETVQEYETFTNDLSVLSYLRESEDGKSLFFAKMDGTDILDENYHIHGIKVNVDKMKYESPESIDEVKREKYVLFDNYKKISLWPTSELMVTFSQLLKIKGNFFFQPGFARNAVLAQEFEKQMDLRFISRKKGNRIFLYGVAGNFFVMEDEDLIPDLIADCEEKYGKLTSCEWEMNDQLIKIFCQFADLTSVGDYQLGINIQTSNVMASSFRCQFVLKNGEMLIPLGGVIKKHTKKITAADVMEELANHEDCLKEANYKLSQTYSKNILDSAKDSKIYNILGKKRLKMIFPSWKGDNPMTKNHLIKSTKDILDDMELKQELNIRVCQLLGYILMNE